MRAAALVPCLLLLAAPPAHAGAYRGYVSDATEAMEDALNLARRAAPGCRDSVQGNIQKAIDDLDAVRRGASVERIDGIRMFVAGLALAAAIAQCPENLKQKINRASGFIGSARDALRQGDGDDDGGGHRRRHHDHDDAPPPPAPGGPATVAFGKLQVQYGVPSSIDGTPTVYVVVPSVTVRGMAGGAVYFGSRFRARGGGQGEWITGTPSTIPSDPFVWTSPYSTTIRYSTFAPHNTGGGHFVVQVSAFNAAGAEIGRAEVPVRVPLAAAPPPAPGYAPPPAPGYAPPAVVQRDCGTGHDAGCAMTRHGQWAMDAETFRGFHGSLRANFSDLGKKDMCVSVLGGSYLTAKQLGMVLDLFSSDLLKMDVAKAAAPHVVNPSHALGLSSKFASSLLQRDFTALMAAQR